MSDDFDFIPSSNTAGDVDPFATEHVDHVEEVTVEGDASSGFEGVEGDITVHEEIIEEPVKHYEFEADAVMSPLRYAVVGIVGVNGKTGSTKLNMRHCSKRRLQRRRRNANKPLQRHKLTLQTFIRRKLWHVRQEKPTTGISGVYMWLLNSYQGKRTTVHI